MVRHPALHGNAEHFHPDQSNLSPQYGPFRKKHLYKTGYNFIHSIPDLEAAQMSIKRKINNYDKWAGHNTAHNEKQ